MGVGRKSNFLIPTYIQCTTFNLRTWKLNAVDICESQAILAYRVPGQLELHSQACLIHKHKGIPHDSWLSALWALVPTSCYSQDLGLSLPPLHATSFTSLPAYLFTLSSVIAGESPILSSSPLPALVCVPPLPSFSKEHTTPFHTTSVPTASPTQNRVASTLLPEGVVLPRSHVSAAGNWY